MLAATLGLPDPALALRQREPEKGTPAQAGLEAALSAGNKPAVVPAAGMEERTLEQFFTLSEEHRVYMVPAQMVGAALDQVYFSAIGLAYASAAALNTRQGLFETPFSVQNAVNARERLSYMKSPWPAPEGNPLLYETVRLLDRTPPEEFAAFVNRLFGQPRNLILIHRAKTKKELLSDSYRRELIGALRHELVHNLISENLEVFERTHEAIKKDEILVQEMTTQILIPLSKYQKTGSIEEVWTRLLEPGGAIPPRRIERFLQHLSESQDPDIQEGIALFREIRDAVENQLGQIWPAVGAAYVDRILPLKGSTWSHFLRHWLGLGIVLDARIRRRWSQVEPPPAAGLEERAELEAAVGRDMGTIAAILKEEGVFGKVVLGLGPAEVESHGAAVVDFLDRLKGQVSSMTPLLVLTGDEADQYAARPSVLLTSKNVRDAAVALKTMMALPKAKSYYAADKLERLEYIATPKEAEEMEAMLRQRGVDIALVPHSLDSLPRILAQILHALAGTKLDLSQSNVNEFYGINLNRLAEQLERLAQLGV